MSKHNKDYPENASFGDMSPEASAGSDNQLQAMPESAKQTLGPQAKSEQSRLFNAWLDRTLPLLQQALGGSTTGAVTSPGSKPKH